MSLQAYFLAILMFCALPSWGADAHFSGAGSSAAAPLYEKLAQAYARSGGAGLDYQPVGSAAGIQQIRERAVDFGASDVALGKEDLEKERVICFPSAISGVVPIVNLPGIKSGDLQLTGGVLADIFARRIRQWNDPAIAALNPRLALPALPIFIIVRQDGSGTTYNFTDYLSQVSDAWRLQFGRGFKIGWPAEAVQVRGSSDLARTVGQTHGAIAYIDYQYVLQDKLVFARLRNRDGKFVAPTPFGFAQALAASGWKTAGKYEEMLTNKPGGATWPIATGTFVIMPRIVDHPERAIAALKFFAWSFLHGDKVVEHANFVRLPDKVQGRVYAEMTSLRDRRGMPLDWSLAGVMGGQP